MTREEFNIKYPNADLTRFEFKKGKTFFKNGEFLLDISKEEFKGNKDFTQYLYWPREWNVFGTVQPFSKQPKASVNLNSVAIFVTPKKSFVLDLNPIDLTFQEPSTIRNPSLEEFISIPYFTSLAASYVATYLCGISNKHFKAGFKRFSSPFLTSIVHYHYVFQMRRFLKHPEKLKRYISNDILKHLQHNPNDVWKSKISNSEQSSNVFTQDMKDLGYEVRYVERGRYGNKYEELVSSGKRSPTDFKHFVPKDSNGLTFLGQKLFQQSLESFVYCVLGSQAKTRWVIVGEGGKSLQTQEVFKKLMEDTIAQDDVTVSISNMRQAIKSTNVILNFAISPGLILIPSDLRILINPIKGFNNVLTMATKEMGFGSNKHLNRVRRSISPTSSSTSSSKPSIKPSPTPSSKPLPISSNNSRLPEVFGASTAIVFGISKLIRLL